MRIGIPRALLYHRYHPAWERFFEALGAEVVISPKTNKQILNYGLESAESEICLPVKVYYGHVHELKDKCDYLFVPRMVAVETKAYTCPKFLGLPDMIKQIEGLPPIIAPTINLKKGKKDLQAAVLEAGRFLTGDDNKIRKAYKLAMKALGAHEKELVRKTVSKADSGRADQTKALRIGLAGHSYNLFDPYISLDLMERLEERGIELYTPENVPQKIIRKSARLAPKDLFWTYERDVLGSCYHWVKDRVVDGIIYVMAFPCGPDSTIQVMVEGFARRDGTVPMMSLVLDEHSAEAGLVTRIEAFVDLLSERKLSLQGA